MKARATALIPFVPSGPDFDAALAFFGDLGFAAAWRNGDIAGLRFGAAYFMLQSIDIPVWQENQMHVVEAMTWMPTGLRSTRWTCQQSIRACRLSCRRISPGAARSTSSIRPASAGISGRARR